MDGHQFGKDIRPDWDPALEEAEIRRQNREADGDVMAWHEFTVRWSTRRGWPTRTGWAALALVGFLLVATLGSWLRGMPSDVLLQDVALLVVVALVSAGLFVFLPQLRQRETAEWRVTVSPSQVALDKQRPRLGLESTIIRRVDAGKLALETSTWIRRSNQPEVVAATGFSIDGTSSIRLSDFTGGRGPFGILTGVPLARVLISWWPANSRSVSALLNFEQLAGTRTFSPYWHPDGVSPRPKRKLSGEL